MLRLLGALAACTLMTLLGTRALEAQDSAPLMSDIPAQPLGPALATFARQTGLHVVYVSKIVRDQHSHAVTAGLTATEALTRLLQDTGLKFEFLTAHSVRLLVAPGAATQAPLASAETPPPLQEIVVTGSRIPCP